MAMVAESYLQKHQWQTSNSTYGRFYAKFDKEVMKQATVVHKDCAKKSMELSIQLELSKAQLDMMRVPGGHCRLCTNAEKDGILPLREKNHAILLPIAMRRLLILLLHKPMKNTYHKASGNMGAAVADIPLGARQCFHAEEALFSQVNATTFTNNLVLQGMVPKQVMDGMQNRSHLDMCLNVRGLWGKVPIQQVWNFEWEIPKALLGHTYTMVLLHWRFGQCFENARPWIGV